MWERNARRRCPDPRPPGHAHHHAHFHEREQRTAKAQVFIIEAQGKKCRAHIVRCRHC